MRTGSLDNHNSPAIVEKAQAIYRMDFLLLSGNKANVQFGVLLVYIYGANKEE